MKNPLSKDISKSISSLKGLKKKHGLISNPNFPKSPLDKALDCLNEFYILAIIDEEIEKTERGLR